MFMYYINIVYIVYLLTLVMLILRYGSSFLSQLYKTNRFNLLIYRSALINAVQSNKII